MSGKKSGRRGTAREADRSAADPNDEGGDRYGPQLLEAAAKGRYEAVEALLRRPEGRAAVNFVDEVRETALYKAVTFNHPNIGEAIPFTASAKARGLTLSGVLC